MSKRLEALNFPLPLGTSIKWQMNTGTLFTAYRGGYNLLVSKTDFGWMWKIFVGGILADTAYSYPNIPTSELDAKVKCERRLNIILNPTNNK